MKPFISIILLFISPIISCGQVQINSLTHSEFDNIEINQQTLRSIKDTKGVLSSIQSLYGQISIESLYSQDRSYKWASYSVTGASLSFSDYNDDNVLELTGFKIYAAASFKIKGTTIRIDDSAKILGQVLVNRDDGITKSVLYSVFSNGGFYSDFIVISITKETNLISRIEYIVPT